MAYILTNRQWDERHAGNAFMGMSEWVRYNSGKAVEHCNLEH